MELPDVESVLPYLQAAETVLTLLAILVGASWTYKLFRQKRQRYPRGGIEHFFDQLPVDEEKTLLRVSARVENKGDVLLRIVCGEIWLLLVRPYPSKLLAAIREGCDPVQPNKLEYEWPIIAERKSQSLKYEVEPGETEVIAFDFVLNSDIRSVLAYTHFVNETKRSRLKFWQKHEIGWNTTTFYNLSHHKTMRPEMPEQSHQNKPEETKQGPPRERPATPDRDRERIQSPQRERPDRDDTSDRLRSEN